MEPSEPMPAVTEKPNTPIAAAFGGNALTEDQAKRLADLLARRMLDRRVRDAFLSHTRSPFTRFWRRMNQTFQHGGKVTWRGK